MAIEFDCPACDATIRVKDDAAGKKGRCPKCKVLLLVPDPGPEEDELEEVEPEEEEEDELEVVVPPPRAETTAPPVVESLVIVEPLPKPIAPAAPREFKPANGSPFPLVTESTRVTRTSKPRTARGRSQGTLLTAVVAFAGFAVVAGAGWLLYRATLPKLPDQITGELHRSANLKPATLAPPAEDAVPSDERDRVMQSLANEGLPVKSEFVSVWLNAEDGELLVSISPGPQSSAVRVPLGELPSLRAMLSQHKDRIASVKQRELTSSTRDFFQDYAAYLEDGTPMTRLPEYRDDVALNAAVGVTGYAVEAIVGSTPFPCVHEDTTGGCYFFPPTNTRKFRIRGRKLPDGTTPLPVDLEVVVKEAESPSPSTTETPEAEPPQAEVAGADADDQADVDATADPE